MIKRLRWLLIWAVAIFSTPSFAAPTVLVMGDSLSASYGIQPQEGWVYLLQQHISAQGYPHQLINASISGETSSGGATRIAKTLEKYAPAVVIIALGANDGLRGLSLKAMKQNLAEMIEKSQAKKAQVLLIGMKLPPNYGPAYNHRFESIFSELSQQYQTALTPFLLQGVGENRTLFQKDGLHPTAQAQAIIMNHVAEDLIPLLRAPQSPKL